MVSDAEIPEETPPQPSPLGREPLPLLRRGQGEVCLEFNHLPFNHYPNVKSVDGIVNYSFSYCQQFIQKMQRNILLLNSLLDKLL